VERDRVALGDLVEDPQGMAPRVHEVLGEDLEPVHGRAPGQDVAEMDGPQAHSNAEVGKIPAIHGNSGRSRRDGGPFPFTGERKRLEALAAALALARALAGLGRDVGGVHWDLAATLALAGVLARPTIGGLAAAHALALVLALAIVLGRGRR